ncbi:hypothetical protein HGRIS_010159 [Hohenbuehelia grisea]|uniref:Uncharacterized protein n=1 Tax=Hohenbuehelia grisea TaxID=104357 RepID=A0ABR3J3S5_9AGAR
MSLCIQDARIPMQSSLLTKLTVERACCGQSRQHQSSGQDSGPVLPEEPFFLFYTPQGCSVTPSRILNFACYTFSVMRWVDSRGLSGSAMYPAPRFDSTWFQQH